MAPAVQLRPAGIGAAGGVCGPIAATGQAQRRRRLHARRDSHAVPWAHGRQRRLRRRVVLLHQLHRQLCPGLSVGGVGAAGRCDGGAARAGPRVETGALLHGGGCVGDVGPVGASGQEGALHPADVAVCSHHRRVPFPGGSRPYLCLAARPDAGYLDAAADTVGNRPGDGATALSRSTGQPRADLRRAWGASGAGIAGATQAPATHVRPSLGRGAGPLDNLHHGG